MRWIATATLLALLGCDDEPAVTAADAGAQDAAVADVGAADAGHFNACRFAGTEGATARCRVPTFPPEHYVAQAELYFDTLDLDQPEENIPDYSELVARWEWPPWLLLTGYGREDLVATGLALRMIDPSRVPERDCRFFDTEPFARCYVSFDYPEGGACPIYEEFVFNDQGQLTFIEAWSVQPGYEPNGLNDDPWGEGPDFPRLSTRVPGLGKADGRIDLDSEWMQRMAAEDEHVADFALRATDWRLYWARYYGQVDKNFFAIGCGWPYEAE